MERLINQVEEAQVQPGDKEELQVLKKPASKTTETLKKIKSSGSFNLQRTNSSSPKKVVERPMSFKEKSILKQNIQKLGSEDPMEILKILKNIGKSIKNIVQYIIIVLIKMLNQILIIKK